jgi:hypothetical protein
LANVFGHAVRVETGDITNLDELLAVARRAVARVVADLHRTTAERPSVAVDAWQGSSVRIVVNGGFTAPSVWERTTPEAIAEVADYIQEQLDQDLGCWPVCEAHNVGLHAEARDGVAVWWCRLGEHRVAAIGELASTAETP